MKTILQLTCFMLLAGMAAAQTSGYASTISRYHKTKNFNGVVLIATNGKMDFIAAKGIAGRQYGVKISTGSKFRIASVTKTFTAALILKLYEQGKIDLKATIGKYFPGYKGEGRNRVSIHHLLTYSSGIPDCEGDSGIAVYQKPVAIVDFIDKYCSGSLVSEPGRQFSYNNGDYIILGYIIEKITGRSFEKYLAETILKPYGMTNTGMLQNKQIVNGLADTYNIDDSTRIFYRDDPLYIENYSAAGAMYSTAEDLLKFDNAIFNHRLLGKKTVELMLTPYPELYGVAYGFWVTDVTFGKTKYKAANRQGSIWGANANWLHLIDDDKTFIVLSNTNATILPELTGQLVLIATRQKKPAAGR